MIEFPKDALGYCHRGFSVIPIVPRHKKPLLTWERFQTQRATEKEIEEWWAKWPDANVGIVTGTISGLVVIDLDSEKAKEEFKELLPAYDLSAVPRSKTGKGWHLFFKHPGVPIQNRAGIIRHMDVRGDGGYVVVPPSIHHSGNVYEWEVGPHGELPKLPPELFNLLTLHDRGQEQDFRERFDTARALAGVLEGERDETIFRLACKLRNADVPGNMAERLVQEAARNCQPPFSESAALEKVDRAFAQYKPAQNLTSDYRDHPSEVRSGREVNLASLQADAKHSEKPPLLFLPVLGQDRLIVKGWSHLIAGYPKSGKTELVVRMIAEWPDERILYITEEPESVWDARMQELPEAYGHVTLYYGLGVKPAEILDRVKDGEETVVILDTVRNLLRLRDETDNSEVARAMIPPISAAREGNKTLLALHHNRKGGGEHGEGITGGHAFLGVVDLALEIKFDGAEGSRRRQLRGWGRVIEVPKLLYELQDDNTMIALGSPALVALKEVEERVQGVMSEEWMTKKEIRGALDDPKPSDDQVAKALNALGADGEAERDPPLSEGQRPGARYKWRLVPNLTSDEPPPRSEVRLEEGKVPKEDQCQTLEL